MINFIFNYYLWTVFVALVYSITSYATYKLNITKNNSWFWFLWFLSVIPSWAIVSRYSKHIVFDGMLFDFIMVVTYTITILFLTRSFESMKLINYIGLICMITGLTLFKWNN